MRREPGTISLDNRQSDVRIWAKWAGHPFEGLLHHKHHGEDHDKDEDVFDEKEVQGRSVECQNLVICDPKMSTIFGQSCELLLPVC